jgi:hypothetical protein
LSGEKRSSFADRACTHIAHKRSQHPNANRVGDTRAGAQQGARDEGSVLPLGRSGYRRLCHNWGGLILRGTTTASLSGGSFNVTDGKLSCGGNYDALDTSPTISMPVLCSDGRRGIIIATRDKSGLSGAGTARMTDGSEATFMFGRAAAGF